MKELLKCCLPETGDKIIVNADVKDTTFTPGTLAYMAHMNEPDNDYQDVVRVRAVVIRRGKTGMDRINVNSLSLPIFRDPRMLEHENYLPVGRKYYVHVDKEKMPSAHVLDMDDINFLGWACARALYMNYLTTTFAKKNITSLWPNSNKDPVVAAARFTEYFESDPKATIEKFAANVAFREQFIAKIRTLECASAKAAILYHKRVESAILNSAKFMVYTNDKYFVVTDKEEAKATVTNYEKRLQWLDKMTMKPVTKNK
jgi:hypothetical protein